jgi:hypothetical protein
MRPQSSVPSSTLSEARRGRPVRMRRVYTSGNERPECQSGLPGTSRRSNLSGYTASGAREAAALDGRVRFVQLDSLGLRRACHR